MTTKDGYSVLDKVAKVGCPSNVAFGDLGVSILHLSNSNTMMAYHHRPLQSSASEGPTMDIDRSITSDIYKVGGGLCSGGGGGGAVVGLRNYLQPFDFSKSATSSAAFKNPVGGRMAASLGFPFTNAQWKELERQAMIYKYMMASVPVPPHLLIPPTSLTNLPSVPTASFSLLGSNGLNLSLRNLGGDLEPGRCKRTDGKKWRCSRDVAPEQKYCERHLNRGRSRSRKPVELLPNNNININTNNNTTSSKKTRVISTSLHSELELLSGKVGTGSVTDSQQNFEFGNEIGGDVATFDAGNSFVLAYKKPRELEWMVKGGSFPIPKIDQDVQWQHHVATHSSTFDYQEEPSNFDLLGPPTTGESHSSTTFLDEVPRGFFDEWPSNAMDTLSSVGGSNAADEMGLMQISLGLVGSDKLASSLWPASTTPGGPLAEVLNLSSATTTNSHTFSGVENGEFGISPAVTTISSPSGVLQKTLASFSDSSGNSSPTLASSRENRTEIVSLWLDQSTRKL